jgi:selenide,water dikinase
VATDHRVLVGNETHDDAGVFLLQPDLALVQTVDFFTPVVDDAEVFGRIAATNALSDIWAMGAEPLTALNLLAVPSGKLDPASVGAMLRGGAEVLREAGVALLGGHSIDDPEPKMGYAVTGLVHPAHIWRNSTARPGDRLYLTKPIGTGVVIKAIKDGVANPEVAEATQAAMLTLNRAAYEAIRSWGDPTACTDVTGFGLLGHAWEMAEGAGTTIEIESGAVPLLPGALELARSDRFPAGSRRNLEYVLPHLEDHCPDPALLALMADAVTAGGLLFTVPESATSAVESAFEGRQVPLYPIGRVHAGPPRVVVR